MNFTLAEIYEMTIDQMFLYCSATNNHLQQRFKESVIATSWGMAGVPDEMKHLFK